MNCNSNFITAKKIISIWRFYIMAKNMMNVAKGVATGLAIGAAVGYVGSMTKSKKRKSKKITNKAIKTVSDIMDSMAKI